ncbi:hypothetical protein PTI98_002064 [Pleurotus ostreatus]|nr:hypothetical protein PTI98_002064 [Pleurotus ostreatus]
MKGTVTNFRTDPKTSPYVSLNWSWVGGQSHDIDVDKPASEKDVGDLGT